jgi:hypothetical protein
MKYTILLILTDGDVSDKISTTREIIRASELPISIIIVGLGKPPDNFEFMRKLDADDAPLEIRDQDHVMQK